MLILKSIKCPLIFIGDVCESMYCQLNPTFFFQMRPSLSAIVGQGGKPIKLIPAGESIDFHSI